MIIYYLKKLIFDKIGSDDFIELKKETENLSDKELDTSLREIWDEMDEVSLMDADVKANILYTINKQIKPVRKSNSTKWTAIAASLIIPVLIAFSFTYYFSNKEAVEKFQVFAEKGQKTRIVLPDNTEVWLNSESSLIYYSDFNKNDRRVKLNGEAFFDVSKNCDKNFIVETNKVNVIVYGTQFNVSTYDDKSSMNVSLLTGKVILEDKINHIVLTEMNPNELVSVNKGGMDWTKSNCDAEVESLWRKNMLKFRNETALEVFQKLERWYGINIQIENPDTTVRYGFTLKNESLREMLDLINLITPITYRIEGEEVNISYKNKLQ